MDKPNMVVYEFDPTKKYIVSCLGSMANAVMVHEQLIKWLASDIPFVVITGNMV